MANVVEVVIRGRDHTDAAFRAARHAISGLARHARDQSRSFFSEGRTLVNRLGEGFKSGIGKFQDVFSDGIGGAVKGGLSTPYLGPIIIAAISALAVTLAPLIAVIIGGALTAGFGAAFVGIGALILAQDEKIKKGFADTFKDVKKTLTDAFEPLKPIFTTVQGAIKRVTDAFAPFIKIASSKLEPHLVSFINNLADAAEALAPILPPMADAFGKILDELGPDLPGIMQDLADALIQVFNAAGDNADTFATTIGLALKAVVLFVRVLGYLMDSFRGNVKAFSALGHAAGRLWEAISEAGSKIIGRVRAIGRTINNLRGKTVRIAQTGASAVISWVGRVIGWIRRFIGKTVHIGVSGVSGAINAVRRLIGWISNLTGKIVNVGVNLIGGAARFLGFAHGGVIGAAGGGPRSGMVMVGEQGRELVRLAAGSQVIPHGQTERMMAEGAGGGTLKLELEWVGTNASDDLFKFIKKNIRIKAGKGSNNVQLALG